MITPTTQAPVQFIVTISGQVEFSLDANNTLALRQYGPSIERRINICELTEKNLDLLISNLERFRCHATK
jgi:hypothetical protein